MSEIQINVRPVAADLEMQHVGDVARPINYNLVQRARPTTDSVYQHSSKQQIRKKSVEFLSNVVYCQKEVSIQTTCISNPLARAYSPKNRVTQMLAVENQRCKTSVAVPSRATQEMTRINSGDLLLSTAEAPCGTKEETCSSNRNPVFSLHSNSHRMKPDNDFEYN